MSEEMALEIFIPRAPLDEAMNLGHGAETDHVF
jgi:hypothetical protein